MTKRMPTDRQVRIRTLELQILLNEMVPAEMRCGAFIAEMKQRLAALKSPGPRLVTKTDDN